MRIATPGASFFWHSVAVATVGLGPRLLRLSSPFSGAECSILMPVTPVAAARFSRRLFRRVMIVMFRCTGFFYPCRQKLQIKKIGRLDSRSAHHVHLLEAEWKAT